MKPFSLKTLTLVAGFSLFTGSAVADPLNIEAVMAPTNVIRMDFKDGSKHFVASVRRTGNATGSGLLAGTSVVEQGWHDINPPFGADPQGYLEMTAENGDVAYIKWKVRAVFTKGEAKPILHDYGFWELFSGTGQFADKSGAGTLQIHAVSKTDRKFILSGEIGDKP